MRIPAFPYHAISQNVSPVKTPEPVAAVMVELVCMPVPMASKSAFKKIEAGLQEALAIARDESGAAVSVSSASEEAMTEIAAATESEEIKVKPLPKRKTATPKTATPKAAAAKTKKKAKG